MALAQTPRPLPLPLLRGPVYGKGKGSGRLHLHATLGAGYNPERPRSALKSRLEVEVVGKSVHGSRAQASTSVPDLPAAAMPDLPNPPRLSEACTRIAKGGAVRRHGPDYITATGIRPGETGESGSRGRSPWAPKAALASSTWSPAVCSAPRTRRGFDPPPPARGLRDDGFGFSGWKDPMARWGRPVRAAATTGWARLVLLSHVRGPLPEPEPGPGAGNRERTRYLGTSTSGSVDLDGQVLRRNHPSRDQLPCWAWGRGGGVYSRGDMNSRREDLGTWWSVISGKVAQTPRAIPTRREGARRRMRSMVVRRRKRLSR